MPAEPAQRWAARPVQAWLIRIAVFVAPIAGSVLFVHVASGLLAVPTSSFLLFILWWVVMSGAATVVLVGLERATRRLLPLAALYRLSLVFPDAAPSRFRTALGSNTVATLEQRISAAKAADDRSTPVESAELLLALVAELDSHDPLTRGHSERVRAYAQMIGKELGLSSAELDSLNWAALLHDVGKLDVPTEILTKPGRPTDEEWQVLRRHPDFGDDLIAPLRGWLGEWADAVPQHHERWDGEGYPRGIAGGDIALAGRIVAVADVFDVITSARSYKSPFASSAARDEIARCAGTQFDPRVVRAFLNISLGRLRLVMGPLSWLAHVPVLGRLPLTPAIGTVTASVAAVAAAVTTGLVGTPPTPGLAGTVPKPPRQQALRVLERETREDESVVIDVVEDGSRLVALRVITQPSSGRVRVTADHRLEYIPPSDFTGTVSVRYEACSPGRGCRRGDLVIRVVPIDDPPIVRDDHANTRGGGALSIDVLANDSDIEGGPLSIVSVTQSKAGRSQIVAERIRWTPRPGFLGKASFHYTVVDREGLRGSALVVVTVSPEARSTPASASPPPPQPAQPPVHPDETDDQSGTPSTTPPTAANAPPAAQVDRLSVPEGQVVTIAVLANDRDPDGDPLSIASVGSPGHGKAERLGDKVRFTAPSDYVGEVTIPYAITDRRGARAGSHISISVQLVNAPPTFTAGPAATVPEDSGPQSVPAWAGNIDAGPPSEAGQTVTFAVDDDAPGLFSTPPAVGPDGALRFTPAPNAYGSAAVTVRARDDGGTANGGDDTSPPQTFSIVVAPVNDPPSFTAGPDQTVLENASSQTITGWARNIVAGPANESRQTVGFVVSVGDPGLFAGGGQPKVTPDGTLSFSPAAGASGSTTVTIRAKDDGGTAGGGTDASAPQTFTIVIDPVNDPPSFEPGADEVLLEDAGLQTIAPWATAVSPGPASESMQSVTFLVSNDNGALFSTQPGISPNGTLEFAAAPNANGSATVTVRAKDDGGTAHGGSDTSAPRTFTITVTSVNDQPITADDGASVAEDDATGATVDVLANDTDPDTGDTLHVSSHDDSAITNGTLTDNGDGTFGYVPDPGFDGTETFTYVVADGTGASASATVTITVTPVPHPPAAGNDAYTTQPGSPLSVTAPGVLGNDGDPDGDPITVRTTPVSGAQNGTVTIAADGGFSYTPNGGFAGTDSFTYRIDDGTGRTADGTVTITVSASPTVASTLYFQTTGPSPDIWDMTPTLAPAGSQLTDFDGDGEPGLTIKHGDGSEATSDGRRFQLWTYSVPAPLVLNGPVALDLWSSTELFAALRSATLYSYLYDCTPGGATDPSWSGCTRIASNAVYASPWNTSLLDWGSRRITIGSVDRTIPVGNELRIRLLVGSRDLWLTATASYPSALLVTLG